MSELFVYIPIWTVTYTLAAIYYFTGIPRAYSHPVPWLIIIIPIIIAIFLFTPPKKG